MMNYFSDWLTYALQTWAINWQWMAWNTWLAVIPLALAYYLFRGNPRRTTLWYLGALTFMAFLPNAPYVLTDILHLVDDIRQGYSIWTITLLLVPQYVLFMQLGFEAYVISVLFERSPYLRAVCSVSLSERT